ncbi:pentapeptide repeat-containing protein [Shewanella sp. P1-14-1]
MCSRNIPECRPQCNLTECNLTECNLTECNLTEYNLTDLLRIASQQ